MGINRREFLAGATAVGAGLFGRPAISGPLSGKPLPTDNKSYKYRLAFDVWINDVRNEAMPLQNWPYGVLDDKTVDGIVRALDVQARFGYTAIDICGLFTTYAWPVDIKGVLDADRKRRVKQIIKAAHDRKMKVICFPSGVLNWGFDEIIKSNPSIRTDNKHEMNPLMEESWQWQYKVLDYVIDNYEVDGIHLEAADQGRCKTPECLKRWPDNVGYFCYVTSKAADYIHRKHPSMIVTTTIQGFGTWGKAFTEREKNYLIGLSKSVDCLFDQGHRGTYISPAEWPQFIPQLHCAYGTSGGTWVYPPQRWPRDRWFLPYVHRTGDHIKKLYNAGGRGIMYYQGPVANPSTEVNVAFGGRMMSNAEAAVDDVLAEALESIYRPRNPAAHEKLLRVFQQAEKVYFDQWNTEKIEHSQKAPPPGELHLTTLFGSTPGPSTYLMEPFLDTEGRLAYKNGLVSVLKDVLKMGSEFDDKGRVARIQKGIEEAIVDINNIAMSKGEDKVWDDRNVGLHF